jgi:hypothetical protein
LSVAFNFGCKKEEPPTIPVVSTATVTDLTGSTATCGGNIISDGRSAITARGVCWSTNYIPAMKDSRTVDSLGTGTFTSRIDGLISGTVYHVRAYATNSLGTAYGQDKTFMTLAIISIVSTTSATNISQTSVTLNGIVNANGQSTKVTFEYDTAATSYGNTVTAFQSPVTGCITTNVNADISGLTPGVTYHFRVKAENSDGTVYGDDIRFTLFACDQVPIVKTLSATNVYSNGATLRGTVIASGWPTTVTFSYLYGVHLGRYVYKTVSATPDTVAGNSMTYVSANTSGFGIVFNTSTFWITATNPCGTVSGNVLTFTRP